MGIRMNTGVIDDGASSLPLFRAVLFFAPFVILGIYLFFLNQALSASAFWTLVSISLAYFIPPAGKETVIPLGIVLGLPWWLVAVSVAIYDILGALFVTWNFSLTFKFPYFGKRVKKLVEGGRDFFDRRPWLERLNYLGLILLVMVPFEGSGGITSAIVGRIMGMRSLAIILCIAIGSFASCFAIALGAEYIWSIIDLEKLPGIEAVLIGFLALAIVLLARAFLHKRKYAHTVQGKNEIRVK
jgi:uncharacterized membrane protein